MNWDAIQNDAKAKGHLVFAVDQAQTAVTDAAGTLGLGLRRLLHRPLRELGRAAIPGEELSGRRRQDVR